MRRAACRRSRTEAQHQAGLELRVIPGEPELRATYREFFGERHSFEEAMKDPGIAICVRNTTAARMNRPGKRT